MRAAGMPPLQTTDPGHDLNSFGATRNERTFNSWASKKFLHLIWTSILLRFAMYAGLHLNRNLENMIIAQDIFRRLTSRLLSMAIASPMPPKLLASYMPPASRTPCVPGCSRSRCPSWGSPRFCRGSLLCFLCSFHIFLPCLGLLLYCEWESSSKIFGSFEKGCS